MVSREPQPLQWSLPEGLDIPPDELKLRLDFYSQAIVMHVIEDGAIYNRIVAAEDISRVLARQIGVSTGFLPPETIWWRQLPSGAEFAIWRRPQVTRIALQEEMFQPATRFTVPMPGLLFLCAAGRQPWVWAMKKRPTAPEDKLYQAPCYNVFSNGLTCAGTHHYGQDAGQIPDEFFTAFFSSTGDLGRRSQKHGTNMKALWEELDGKRKFPNDDLVEVGYLGDVMGHPNLWRSA